MGASTPLAFRPLLTLLSSLSTFTCGLVWRCSSCMALPCGGHRVHVLLLHPGSCRPGERFFRYMTKQWKGPAYAPHALSEEFEPTNVYSEGRKKRIEKFMRRVQKHLQEESIRALFVREE